MSALTPKDVAPHADAMAKIEAALTQFPPEQQLVIVAGVLGNVLCKTGKEPSKIMATMLVGTAVEMVFDMINRTFPGEGA